MYEMKFIFVIQRRRMAWKSERINQVCGNRETERLYVCVYKLKMKKCLTLKQIEKQKKKLENELKGTKTNTNCIVIH